MRRWGRSGAGGMTHAHRAVAAPIPDSISLIRSFDSETITTRPVRPSPLTASTVGGLPLDLLDRLRSFPLFLSAPDSFLVAIGSFLRPQLHNSHDYILTEGDDAKAMYWLVRGAVRVTSRDGESTYAELKPGAFFGEIGILMDMPRTATIIAKLKSLVVRLNKEDLQKVLPQFPEVERAIRDEAVERLSILERQKKERKDSLKDPIKSIKRPRERSADKDGADYIRDGGAVSTKKRKSPSPGIIDTVSSISMFRSGALNVRQLLKELPLFSELPQEILHFIGLNAEPRTYPPFTDIVKEGAAGRDIYFIVSGEVEVVSERPDMMTVMNGASSRSQPQVIVKARLKVGQYFGEVTSLSLAPTRTATVRSVTSVECLMIPHNVLNELWAKCSPDLRASIEKTARQRLQTARDNDVSMSDTVDGTPPIDELALVDRARRQSVPTVTFTGSTPEASPQLRGVEDKTPIEPYDPDPYLNVDLENVKSRSRRGSLAPPSPSSPSSSSATAEPKQQESPSKPNGHIAPISRPSSRSSDRVPLVKRPKGRRIPTHVTRGPLPDNILTMVLDHLDVLPLMQARAVSSVWRNIINTSTDLLTVLDLTPYNRFVTDTTVKDVLSPFIKGRPKVVDINNCFHLTDEGFAALALACGENVRVWRMKSVWDVTGQAVLEMVNRTKRLEEIDLSNCRKVGDNLLARVVGWVVPEIPQQQQQHAQQMQMQMAMQNGRFGRNKMMQQQAQQGDQQNGQQQPPQQTVPPGTIIGCPALKALTLSYCKHITDRSMAHIAAHAAARLESIDLTRCTTITDAGFQHWSVWKFPNLKRLVLADCTYLTDQAIVGIVGAARGLRVLDLVS